MKITDKQEIQFENQIILFLITIWNRLIKREIGFMDVVIILITAISITIIHWTDSPDLSLLLWRWALMLPLMCLIALINNNYDKYNEKFNYTFTIMTSDLPIQDKAEAIKSEIKKVVTVWDKYNRQYKKIVEGDESFGKKTVMLGSLINRVLEGKITVPQGIYIICYSFYNIVIGSNLFNIPDPYDIMINVIFIFILRYWGAEYSGMGELLDDFITALSPDKSDLEKEQAFIELGDKMKDGCYASFILTSEECIKNPCPLEGKIIEKDNIKTKANGSDFTSKEVELIQAKELSEALGEAKTITDDKRDQLIQEINTEKKE